jgi:hypothetical protein
MNDLQLQDELWRLIQGFKMTQAIYVVTKLGIPDLLKEGPRSYEELAQETHAHAPSLYRVLRLLTALGLFTEGEAHRFAVTPMGAFLQTGVAGSMHNMVLRFGYADFWQVWRALLYSVQTGQPSWEHVFGLSPWQYRAQNPEAAAVFDAFMAESIANLAPAVVAAYDFSTTSSLVDVGGGRGQLLGSILQTYQALHGVLFDLPHVVAEAFPLLERAEVTERCQIIGGDAFKAVPADYETYLLSRVIHDWDDEHAVTLLTRCQQAMQPQGKVLLVEYMILADRAEVHVLESDVNMLVAMGGKERTDAEYRALLSAAGLTQTRLLPVLPPYYLIEAVRVTA